jgi:hypothetical protein
MILIQHRQGFTLLSSSCVLKGFSNQLEDKPVPAIVTEAFSARLASDGFRQSGRVENKVDIALGCDWFPPPRT